MEKYRFGRPKEGAADSGHRLKPAGRPFGPVEVPEIRLNLLKDKSALTVFKD
jgi:hypothetical protein